jgi:hypothetical protein
MDDEGKKRVKVIQGGPAFDLVLLSAASYLSRLAAWRCFGWDFLFFFCLHFMKTSKNGVRSMALEKRLHRYPTKSMIDGPIYIQKMTLCRSAPSRLTLIFAIGPVAKNLADDMSAGLLELLQCWQR